MTLIFLQFVLYFSVCESLKICYLMLKRSSPLCYSTPKMSCCLSLVPIFALYPNFKQWCAGNFFSAVLKYLNILL